MQKSLFWTVLLTFSIGALQAQTRARIFLDIPAIYLAAPDVENISRLAGLGAETALNVGTHWGVSRLGGGATFTLDPKSDDLGKSFNVNPYAMLEAGVGKYRSNGNRCARTKQNAYTILAKGGVRYNFFNKDVREVLDKNGEIDYTLGAEFSYFFIRDVFRNNEIFLAGNYLTQSKVISVNFGFKVFLNLRAGAYRSIE